jgi:hypothetical protein
MSKLPLRSEIIETKRFRCINVLVKFALIGVESVDEKLPRPRFFVIN